MTLRQKRIRSCPDSNCQRPWVEYTDFTVTPAVGIAFTVAKVTGPAASQECATVDEAKERSLEGAKAMPFDPTAPLERHVLVITLGGEFAFVPESKISTVTDGGGRLYAHLAYVDPVSGQADVLVFVQDSA